MNKVSSYWEATKNTKSSYPKLEGNFDSEVVVIGGGFSGLSTAYFLSKKGIKVTLLEQSSIGWGASGRNAGMLTTGYKNSIASLSKKHGKNNAKQLLDFSKDCIKLIDQIVKEENIDCSLNYNGGLKLAFKKQHFEDLKNEQEYMYDNFNYETKLIYPSDMNNEINSPIYKYGALLDSNSFSFHPLNYAIGLSNSIDKYGGIIYENSKVVSLTKNKDEYVVKTNEGQIISKNVVIATNGYSTSNVHKDLTKTMMSIDSHVITTEKLENNTLDQILPTNRVASDTKNFLYYFRKTTDNRLLFGGRVSFGNRKDSQNKLELYEELRKNMVKVFPNLRNADIDYKWAGTTAFPMDFMPHVGKTREGVYYLLGYCGHGAAMSTFFGKIISDSISKEINIPDSLNNLKLTKIPFHNQQNTLLSLAENYMKFKDIIS
ncbi:NAD(P)/FAD-dependent oxidoreductase [Salinicoccus albus]|uniref:NAD(P)/FAD-dependent oxidoreductase n=1 Tax=Salinicoccus albus TaxID=418756 RepID=UPI000369489D|nr:FAD-dependent oxidoreductase [Salinicoccus albus]